ncbi:hypothetical protein TcG_09267 [Trypanosoma cruzi]|nr:hypothetical protein TcG_09267 [Trypanosoma cruzi]
MRAAERQLHLFACRACRCCEEVQATSHHWAAEAVFPLYSAGEATLPAGAVLFCIDVPKGLSLRRAVAVQLSCSSLHKWPPLICLFCRAIACGPPLGGCSLFKYLIFIYAVEGCWRIMAAGMMVMCFALSGGGVNCCCAAFLPLLFVAPLREGSYD